MESKYLRSYGWLSELHGSAGGRPEKMSEQTVKRRAESVPSDRNRVTVSSKYWGCKCHPTPLNCPGSACSTMAQTKNHQFIQARRTIFKYSLYGGRNLPPLIEIRWMCLPKQKPHCPQIFKGRRQAWKSGRSSHVVAIICPPVEIGLTDLPKSWRGHFAPAGLH